MSLEPEGAATVNAPVVPSAAPLRSRMLKAAGWLVGGNISSQLLRLGSNLILTRLLVPQAYGLIAAVNTLYFALVMFSDLGVWQSVVKSDRGDDPRFLGTAWSVQLARGVLLCAVVLLAALARIAGNFDQRKHASTSSIFCSVNNTPSSSLVFYR